MVHTIFFIFFDLNSISAKSGNKIAKKRDSCSFFLILLSLLPCQIGGPVLFTGTAIRQEWEE